jgi:CubicO group peptidase (beta-lactamase class C family)
VKRKTRRGKIMKRKWVVLITTITLLVSFICQDVSAYSARFSEKVLNEVNSYVEEQFRKARIVGGSYAIISGDKVLEAKGIGYIDLKLKKKAKPETVYAIASVTKVLTATAILQLHENGKLNINEPVQKYLPWFSFKDKEKSKKVTIAHLLTHSAGINRFEADGSIFIDEKKSRNSIEEAVRLLNNVEMQYEPGSKGQYCNTCYNTLGLIIEEVTGVNYDEYMKIFVYQPLGMNNTFYGDELEKFTDKELAKEYSWLFGFRNTQLSNYRSFGKSQDPEGGVYTNVLDMAKYVSASLGYGSLLKDDTLKKSYEGMLQTEHAAWLYTYSGFEAGNVSNKFTLYKGGEGIGSSASIMMMPEEQMGVVLFIGESNSEPKQSIAKGMLQILMEETPENNQYPLPLFKIAGTIMFITSLLSLMVLSFIVCSIYQRIINRNRTIKHRWISIFLSFITVIPLIGICYLFMSVRPTQIGFYGYPLDIALGLTILALTMLVSFIYHIYLWIFGKKQ